MRPDTRRPAADVQWTSAWADALDALELDVATTEAMLAEQHRFAEAPAADPWRPPEGLGPLPLDLRPRADAILARQVAAAAELTRRLAANRQQSAVVARIETGERVKRPAYLDRAL
jgi:hypothetical protein